MLFSEASFGVHWHKASMCKYQMKLKQAVETAAIIYTRVTTVENGHKTPRVELSHMIKRTLSKVNIRS